MERRNAALRLQELPLDEYGYVDHLRSDVRSADQSARRKRAGNSVRGLRIRRAPGGDRSRYRTGHGAGAEGHGGARRGPRDQSDADRRTDRRRRRAGPGHGADGGILSRQRRESARLPDSVGRRHSSGRIDPDRRSVVDRPVWREGNRRAGGDSDGACDSQRDSRCDRRTHPQDSSHARPRARGDSGQGQTEARVADDAIRCDACPVLCYIKPGRTGSCDRYGNHDGQAGAARSARGARSRRGARRFGRAVSRARPRMGRHALSATARRLSPRLARARRIPTTSPRPSSSRRRSKASTWSRS